MTYYVLSYLKVSHDVYPVNETQLWWQIPYIHVWTHNLL